MEIFCRDIAAVALAPKTKPGNSRRVVRFAAFVYNLIAQKPTESELIVQ